MGVATKVPELPRVTIKDNPELQRFADAVTQTMEVREGRRGDKLDKAVTYRDLVGVGLARPRAGLRAPVEGAVPPVEAELPTMPTPPAPERLVATGGIGAVFLDWVAGWTVFENYAYTNVYRATTDDFGAATLLGTAQGGVYVDNDVTAGLTYHYWITYVNTDDIEGPINATAGTSATPEESPQRLLDLLDGALGEDQFAENLRGPISLLPEYEEIPEFDASLSWSEDDFVLYRGWIYRALEDMEAPTPLPTDEAFWVKLVPYTSLIDSVDEVQANVEGEAQARIQALQDEAAARTAEIQASADTLQTEIDGITAQLADIEGTPAFDDQVAYVIDDMVTYQDGLYRCILDTTVPSPLPTDETYWEKVGDYASLGDAVADHSIQLDAHDLRITSNEASAAKLNALITNFGGDEAEAIDYTVTYVDDNSATAEKLNTLTANLGGDEAAAMTYITAEVDANSATASTLNTLVSEFGGNEAEALDFVTTHVDTNSALASDVSQLELDVAANTEGLAGKADASSVTTLEAFVDEVEEISEFDPEQSYVDGDFVTWDGYIHIAIADNPAPSQSPANLDYWAEVEAYTTLGPKSRVTVDRLDTLTASLGGNEADALSHITTHVDTNSATAEKLNTLTAQFGGDEAAAIDYTVTYVDENSATASKLNTLTTQLGGDEAEALDFVTTHVDTNSSTAAKTDTLVSQFGGDEAAALNYITTHVDADSALASDVSQLQLDVDGNSAAIEERATISALNGVEGDVTDIQAQWTIKTDVNGLVSGIGLMNDGQTSAFGVLADQFWVAGADESGTANPDSAKVPFIVRTSSTTINGVSVPDGVYIRDAFIENGSIDNAKIGDAVITSAKIGDGEIKNANIDNASITNAKIANAAINNAKIANAAISEAKIGNAEVDTLKLRGQAVTFPKSQYVSSTLTLPLSGTYDPGPWRTAASVVVNSGSSSSMPVSIIASLNLSNSGGQSYRMEVRTDVRLVVGGTVVRQSQYRTYVESNGANDVVTIQGSGSVGSSNTTVSVQARHTAVPAGNSMTMSQRYILAIGTKR